MLVAVSNPRREYMLAELAPTLSQFNTFIHCPTCGSGLRCRHCDIGMVFYRKRQVAICHYCDYEAEPPERCPECDVPGMDCQHG